MSKLDDNKTDKLFQTGAQRHDFVYEPAAWEQMEGLLDADDRRRRWWWIGGVLLAIALLTTGAVYWSSVAENNSQAIVVDEVGSDLSPGPASSAAAFGGPGQRGGEAGAVEKDKAPDLVLTTPESQALSHPSPLERDRGRGQGEAGTDLSSDPVSSAAAFGVPGERGGEEGVTARATAGDAATNLLPASNAPNSKLATLPSQEPSHPSPLTAEGNRAAYSDRGRGQTERNDRAIKAISPLPTVLITSIPYTTGQPVTASVEAQEQVARVASGFHPGFAATLSVGQASGMVETGDFGPPDYRFGAKLDYRFSNKLSIGTGAYYSNICYRVDGSDYKADNGFWAQGIVPKDVQADCDILEVPVSLTWFPHGSDRSGFYFGGGLTSYFMLTEKFDFKYDQTPASDSPLSWREDNTNNHLFGLGQFNLGYQRKAGRRSAFQVEAFVQLPLTEIGHGEVNLMTVGASVNYTFDFRKRK